MTVSIGMPFEAGLVVATLAAGLLGFLIGLPTLRLDGDYLAIATLGLGEIIRICILNIDYVGGASGLMGIPGMTNFAYTFWIMIAIIFFIKNFKKLFPMGVAASATVKTKLLQIPWVSTLLNIK